VFLSPARGRAWGWLAFFFRRRCEKKNPSKRKFCHRGLWVVGSHAQTRPRMQQPNPDFFHSSRGKIRNLLEGTVPCCALRLGIDSLPHERNALDSSVLLEKSFKGLTSNTTLVPYSQDMHCTLHGPQRSPIPGQITGFGNGVWTRIRQSISCSLVQTKSLHGYGRCLNTDQLDRSYSTI